MSDNVVALARPHPPEPTKAGKFRALRQSPDLEFVMEAHNGLSAKIAEEAGFKGLWASGLSISTALGVRDRNEASWAQVLEVLEFMSDATSVPILLDGDTGLAERGVSVAVINVVGHWTDVIDAFDLARARNDF